MLSIVRCLVLRYFMPELSPAPSKFTINEKVEGYERWFCAKVRVSLADLRPGVPHNQVMAEMDAIIEAAEQPSRKQA